MKVLALLRLLQELQQAGFHFLVNQQAQNLCKLVQTKQQQEQQELAVLQKL